MPQKKEAKPATELMKKVAAATMNRRNMERVFTKAEIDEIVQKHRKSLPLEDAEKRAVRERYHIIKMQVQELERGNKSKLIVYPSLVSGDGWYKVANFSALYYSYRLAPRMGRKASLQNDKDNFCKMRYVASITKIDRFLDQFRDLEGADIKETEDGIFILGLQKELTDDEVALLKRTESTRRDSLHNLLKPAAMDPDVYTSVLTLVRQVDPRVRKLDKNKFRTTGENMVQILHDLLTMYYDFADGFYERKEAGIMMVKMINRFNAGLTILTEEQAFSYDAALAIGMNMADTKAKIKKNFGLDDVAA